MTAHFADRLHEAILTKKSPCCIGLDPRLDWLPDRLKRRVSLKPTAASLATIVKEFHERILDQITPLVPAIKPQLAFFEQLGSAGIEAFESLVLSARQRNLLVIADAKRGDIGPTADAYARSFLGGVTFLGANIGPPTADCLTVNPFFGTDGVKPFIDIANSNGAGLYILVRTSNPSSSELQLLKSSELTISEHIASSVEKWGAAWTGSTGYSSIGAVVGATHPADLLNLRKRMPRTPFLLPGYGAQGGRASDVVDAFDQKGLGALVVAARSVNFAYRRADGSEEPDWELSVRKATEDMVADITTTLAAAGKWNS